MIALIVSYFIVAYLLIPRALFKTIVSFVLPQELKFQRSRTEEITFSIWVSIIPLCLAILWQFYRYGPPSPQGWFDFQEVVSSAYSEGIFDKNPALAWDSVGRLAADHGYFLVPYYGLVAVEAALFALLVDNYGAWKRKCRIYEWFVERSLIRAISEWDLLLTPFNFPHNEQRAVEVDLLTEDDHLYQGEVLDYFVDADGKLAGVMLIDAQRFDRVGYLRDKEKEPTTKPEEYWKKIPSAGAGTKPTFFIAGPKVLTLNIRYPSRNSEAVSEATQAFANERFIVTETGTKEEGD